ncbi:hypothetical protein CJ198_09635 [Brevibacterium luteolum]|uniref:Isochorismatase-like domain-containing protein n=2 Tax=Brevibacterium luteolum TaxID=199591 RepID=A0A2N6PG46_9MICO|nr:hypothetical protein CJ198_09635 [Brevibacterium luteolum]
MLEAMDALMLMNTAGSGDALSEISAQLTEVLNRARVADGVVAYLRAPAPEAGAGSGADADSPAGGLGQTEDDLALSSEVADAFDGIDDLAAGLHDLAIDRLIIGGIDVDRSVYHTAMAGLACNFDVVVLKDGVIAADGQPVDWADAAAGDGAVLSDAAQTWLRM